MAATNFSGPVVSTNGFTGNLTGDATGHIIGTSVRIAADTAANIADVDSDVNTNGYKAAGVIVFDTTNNLLYVATGSAAADDWALIDGVGSTAVTPS